MRSSHPMKVPRQKLEEARSFQQECYKRTGFMPPLWQCLIEVENRKRQKGNDSGFFGGFRW